MSGDFPDGVRWVLEITGGTPTVDDRTEGELTVRWRTESPPGAIILTFDERSVSMRGEGPLTDTWFLELTSDRQAELPFNRIDRQRVSCTYKNAP